MINASNLAPRIGFIFKRFRKQIRDTWESYELLNFYLPILHDLIKSDGVKCPSIENVIQKTVKTMSKKNTYGAISHLTRSANPKRTLIFAVALTEDYLSALAWEVYKTFPNKLIERSNNDDQKTDSLKPLTIILNSSTRDEMIDKIIEEKLRGIFYGNPLDYFIKDKAQLSFGEFYKNNLQDELMHYREVIACRNVIAHNGGTIDSKFMREVKATAYKEGQAVKVSRDFMKKSIFILETLAASASILVIKNICKESVRSILSDYEKRINSKQLSLGTSSS